MVRRVEEGSKEVEMLLMDAALRSTLKLTLKADWKRSRLLRGWEMRRKKVDFLRLEG